MKSSAKLVEGQLYARNQLQEIFDIKDATINNGIFRPKGHESIWLFVTEDKTSDRTQYIDHYDGAELFMDGQSAGRTDLLIIGHFGGGLEVLLFHRRSKVEHPGAAFRYEGKFRYVNHNGTRPAHFHFVRA